MVGPDDEFFASVWREISLGSDALWKLKQRSVTQLSVVCLLVSKKYIYTVSGVTFPFKGSVAAFLFFVSRDNF